MSADNIVSFQDPVNNQTTQTLAISFRIVCDLNPFRDYTRLEVCKTRVKVTDPGTVVWSLTGPEWIKEPRKILTEEQLFDCLKHLFYEQAFEVDPPVPKPKLLFGNLRLEDIL